MLGVHKRLQQIWLLSRALHAQIPRQYLADSSAAKQLKRTLYS